MDATELIEETRDEIKVIQHCVDFFFGYARNMSDNSFDVSVDEKPPLNPLASVVDYAEQKREFNLRQIKTYNMIKTAIWNCVIVEEQDKED